MAPLVSLIDAGIDAGILRPMDSQLMARALFGMIIALVRHHLMSGATEVDSSAITDTLSLFLEGAAARLQGD
jgi:hypothetical protein